MFKLLTSLATLCVLLPALCLAQDAAATAEGNSPKSPVEILEEPKIVDPIQFMPEPLQKKVTVDLSDAPLSQFFDWLNEHAGLPVIVESSTLEKAKVKLPEVISIHASDLPLYLILNRLEVAVHSRLTWYVNDGILFMTSQDAAKSQLEVRPYNVSSLIDDGYSLEALVSTIYDQTSGPWMEVDGLGGSITTLGDVLFVNQSPTLHHEVSAIVQGLKTHGLETRLLVSEQRLQLEQRLDTETIAFNFDEQRLDHVIQVLREQTGLEILVDWNDLREGPVNERTFVTLNVPETKLKTAIRALLAPFLLDAAVRGGYLLIQHKTASENQLTNAIYDVRDLCRDNSEVIALVTALQNQTSGPWFDMDGVGGEITTPRTGTLMVRHNDEILRQVRTLLATYREALLNSKPRELTKPIDLEEQVTRYYRLETSVAEGLEKLLPQLVSPETWKSDTNPEGGTILVVAGGTDVVHPTEAKLIAASGHTEPNLPSKPALALPNSAMIIRQSRQVHVEIGKVISRIQSGDRVWRTEEEAKLPEGPFLPVLPDFFSGGGLGGGSPAAPPPPAPAGQQGGFGGGYF